jgi:hypothetical protein
MRDGDDFRVCCTCGTEFLRRTMYEAARDLWQCARCYRLDQCRRGQVTEADDDETDEFDRHDDGGES